MDDAKEKIIIVAKAAFGTGLTVLVFLICLILELKIQFICSLDQVTDHLSGCAHGVCGGLNFNPTNQLGQRLTVNGRIYTCIPDLGTI